ncbi:MAG: PEP-CTERM sorting domain-containing protein [Cytophagales bacterium]|nr:PEP-CTERM sorting domain-containing protein [Armatimonadota bacterium]
MLTAGQTDGNYTLLQGNAGGYGPAVYATGTGFPIPPYLANSASSQWIHPDSPANQSNHAAGNYTFRTTFDLSAFDPATASVSLSVAVDNALTSVLLNGVATGLTYNSFAALSSPFTLNSGFTSGINTLDFVVVNSPGTVTNPVGLRVQIDRAVATIAAPEPGSLALIAFGTFPILGAIASRRRKAK